MTTLFRLAPALVSVPGLAAADGSSLSDRIDAYVLPYVRGNNFGGALLVSREGRVLVRKAYGSANLELEVPNRPETRFHIASLSKSFTAAAVLLLEQRGKLRLDDRLAKFLPGYPNGERITLHHLLAHTSGVPNANQFPGYDDRSRFPQPLPDLVAWIRERPLDFEPGARYRYSNSNYNLLAAVIEAAAGERYGDFLRRRVLDPLGLRDTGHDPGGGALLPHRASGYAPVGADGLENAPYLDWSIKTGNGSLYSTVDDLHVWIRALRGERLLDAERRRKMFTEHTDGVGYGWFLGKGRRPSVYLRGRSPGFAASVELFPDEDLVVVLLSNVYSSIAQSMAPDVAGIALGEDRAGLLPPSPVTVPDATLARYVGHYQFGADFGPNPNLKAEVRRVPEGLALVSNDGGTSFLIPLAEDRFLDRAYGGTLRFVTDAGGTVTELTWSFGREYRAARLR